MKKLFLTWFIGFLIGVILTLSISFLWDSGIIYYFPFLFPLASGFFINSFILKNIVHLHPSQITGLPESQAAGLLAAPVNGLILSALFIIIHYLVLLKRKAHGTKSLKWGLIGGFLGLAISSIPLFADVICVNHNLSCVRLIESIWFFGFSKKLDIFMAIPLSGFIWWIVGLSIGFFITKLKNQKDEKSWWRND